MILMTDVVPEVGLAAPSDDALPSLDGYEEPAPGELVEAPPMNKHVPGKSSPRRLAQMERQRRAVALRSAGASYQQIADALGYASERSAYDSVRRALARINSEAPKELLVLRKEQLNSWLRRLQPAIEAGDTKAIDTAMRITMRLDALSGVIEGTSTTTNNTLIIIEGDEDEYVSRLQMMMGEKLPEGISDGTQASPSEYDYDQDEDDIPEVFIEAAAKGLIETTGVEAADGTELPDI